MPFLSLGRRPNGGIDLVPTWHTALIERQSSQPSQQLANAMGEFFSNVSRYPKYLITIVLGVFASALDPLIRRSSNPITAVSLIGALVSGLITLAFVLRAMVFPTSLG